MVSYLESECGVFIKKQSLDERFNEKCVSFIKAVLSEVIQDKLQQIYHPDLFRGLNCVRIKDSTKFTVPSQLESQYKGCGGSGSISKAGICIQYEYDLKSGRILDLSLTPSVRNDRSDAGETAENVSKNDLIIRDLGYFSIRVFETILQKEAYFLSRLDSISKVYDWEGQEISFSKIYKEMQKTDVSQKEMFVQLGRDVKVPVRLILRIVPEEVYQQRIREKTRASKRQGRGQLTEETRVRSRFNLFITNANEERLPTANIFPLYRLR
jgi:hypothetical protein